MVKNSILAAFFRPRPQAAATPEQESGFRFDETGAVVSEADVEVGAPPEIVFGLLDPSSSANRWANRGDKVEAVDKPNGLYRLFDHRMPDEPFLMQVHDLQPPTVVSMTTTGDGGAPIGAIAQSMSCYRIEPFSGGSRVTLTERATFVDGLSKREKAQHAGMIGDSVKIDLYRLKEEAERA